VIIGLQNRQLDSHDPVSGEIISKKATDLDQITESTFRGYLLDGLKLEGK